MKARGKLVLVATMTAAACSGEAGKRSEVASYLVEYEREYQRLYYESSLAEWESNTRIVEGDTTNAARTKRAKEALAQFVGSVENIEKLRGFLEDKAQLDTMQVRQLERMLYLAGASPQTAADVVRRRIALETEQIEKLYGFTFLMKSRAATPNQIDSVLSASRSMRDRQAAWEASKEVGKVLRPGLVQLRDLRNESVRALEYPDFFTYQVSEYGMTTQEMLDLTDKLIRQIWPLYREVHTWARYELAQRYGVPVPEMLPAHWLPNRWGQQWDALVSVEGLPIDSALARRTPEWIVKSGEEFWVSLGFEALPPTFWEKSSLYDLPADAPYKKNTHASAWHMDLDTDVRSLMSVQPNANWYETAIHELGHVYYYMSYSRPEVPVVLREGANRAYHEGIGSMLGVAASQRSFLVNRGLAPANAKVDPTTKLLQEALSNVVFIPWSAGVMTRFEHEFYANGLPAEKLNATWWELVRKYQGIVPPAPRDESFTDAATKTHITDDPAQYYDYALSYALLFQLHDYIARNLLKQDPRDTDYWGNRDVGNFLRTLMAPGASRPWREVLRETTGRELDAQAIVDYFAPLQIWLVEQNKGRTHTLPETI